MSEILPIVITGYRLEHVDVPAARDKWEVFREVLSGSPPAPAGPTTRMLRIVIEGETFPFTEQLYEVHIGDQVVRNLSIHGTGTAASGLLRQRPSEGDQIAIHVPTAPAEEPRVLVAGVFDTNLLDDATA